MSEEAKKPEDGNGKVEDVKPQIEIKPGVKKDTPKDFKIAEIWIKDGTVALDACPDFWMDKLRSCGILDFCKDIVKQYKPRDKKEPLIKRFSSINQGFRNFIKTRRK